MKGFKNTTRTQYFMGGPTEAPPTPLRGGPVQKSIPAKNTTPTPMKSPPTAQPMVQGTPDRGGPPSARAAAMAQAASKQNKTPMMTPAQRTAYAIDKLNANFQPRIDKVQAQLNGTYTPTFRDDREKAHYEAEQAKRAARAQENPVRYAAAEERQRNNLQRTADLLQQKLDYKTGLVSVPASQRAAYVAQNAPYNIRARNEAAAAQAPAMKKGGKVMKKGGKVMKKADGGFIDIVGVRNPTNTLPSGGENTTGGLGGVTYSLPSQIPGAATSVRTSAAADGPALSTPVSSTTRPEGLGIGSAGGYTGAVVRGDGYKVGVGLGKRGAIGIGGKVRFAKGGAVKGAAKVAKVMGEFKRGELHSGAKKGPAVTNPKQATAIALSEARKAGAKIPVKKAKGGMPAEGVSTRPVDKKGRPMTDAQMRQYERDVGTMSDAEIKALGQAIGRGNRMSAEEAGESRVIRRGPGGAGFNNKPLVGHKHGGLAVMPRGKKC